MVLQLGAAAFLFIAACFILLQMIHSAGII